MSNSEMYTGSTADGSDMYPVMGMFLNPDNEDEFSNMPYNEEQRIYERDWKLEKRRYLAVISHIKGKRTVQDEYNLIMEKKSTLSKEMRNYVIDWIENVPDENE